MEHGQSFQVLQSQVLPFHGVAPVSANDVWALGSVSTTQTLTEHWNGTSWSMVPSPIVGGAGYTLTGVASISTSDVWAAGDFGSNGNPEQTLIEHWNGTSWSIVSVQILLPK